MSKSKLNSRHCGDTFHPSTWEAGVDRWIFMRSRPSWSTKDKIKKKKKKNEQ